jgi:hypothetical protein
LSVINRSIVTPWEVRRGEPPAPHAGGGEELLDAARDAFSQGMRVTAVVCAVVAAGIAVLVRHSLREHVDPAAAQAEITLVEALLATC